MNSSDFTSFGGGIHAVDGHYARPRLVAIHLIVEDGRAAIFDTGTNSSLPYVLRALEALGISNDRVEYVIPSHVHLDHAGGAGSMIRAFKNARLIVHPRGARHMADPTKLVAGTVAVYGEDVTRAMYGEILPIDPQRIVEAGDGMRLDLAGRELRVLDTPGHARHHICLHDPRTGSVFSGDVFGLSYRELDVDGRPSIFPTTTPVQFDPPELHRSIDRVLALRPEAIYLTHYSQVRDCDRLGADLHRLIEAHCRIARDLCDHDDRHTRLLASISDLLLAERERQGWRIDEADLLEFMAPDVELNAQGLEVWLDQQP